MSLAQPICVQARHFFMFVVGIFSFLLKFNFGLFFSKFSVTFLISKWTQVIFGSWLFLLNLTLREASKKVWNYFSHKKFQDLPNLADLVAIWNSEIFRQAFLDHVFLFFLWKMTFSNPPTPKKYGKFHTFLFFIFDAFPY